MASLFESPSSGARSEGVVDFSLDESSRSASSADSMSSSDSSSSADSMSSSDSSSSGDSMSSSDDLFPSLALGGL